MKYRSSNVNTSTRTHQDALTRLLANLGGVVDRGHGQYVAKCPTHDDKSPSLSIKETGDGTILIRCFAGCSIHEIVSAVGMELRDLFLVNLDNSKYKPSQKPRYNYRDLLFVLSHESLVVFLAANDLKNGKALSATDQQQLEQACARIQRVKEVAANA